MCNLQYTWIAAGVLSVVFCIIWPVLTIPAGAFSKGYFTFFVIISIIWALIASVIAIFLPLWESRDVFARCASTDLHLLKMIILNLNLRRMTLCLLVPGATLVPRCLPVDVET